MQRRLVMENFTRKSSISLMCIVAYMALICMMQILPLGALKDYLSPENIPVMLCGFLCGMPHGLIAGFIAGFAGRVLFGTSLSLSLIYGCVIALAALLPSVMSTRLGANLSNPAPDGIRKTLMALCVVIASVLHHLGLHVYLWSALRAGSEGYFTVSLKSFSGNLVNLIVLPIVTTALAVHLSKPASR